jgi:fluoride exporter
MTNILLVGLGGFIGSVARYKLGGWVLHLTVQEKFPFSTFAVNVAGCLVAGVLAGLVEKYELFSPEARLLLFTGLLGGFTTFSAFGLETLSLLRRGEPWVAATYVGASVLLASSRFGLASRSFTCCARPENSFKITMWSCQRSVKTIGLPASFMSPM